MVKLKFMRARGRRISIAMILMAALMAMDAAYQTSMHLRWRRWLPQTLAAGSNTTRPAGTQPAGGQPEAGQRSGRHSAETLPSGTQPFGTQPARSRPSDTQPAGSRPAAATATAGPAIQPSAAPPEPPVVSPAIRKRSLFAPPQPKAPRPALTGVLGSIALFRTADGRTIGIAEGESSQGMKVKAIRDYEVVVEFEGKTDTVKLFNDPGSSRPRGPGAEAAPDPRSSQ